MLTIRTKVFEPGSFTDKLNNFLQYLYNPAKISWMKKLYDRINKHKKIAQCSCYINKGFEDIDNLPVLDRNDLDNISFEKIKENEYKSSVKFIYNDIEYFSEIDNKHNVFVIDGHRYVYIYETKQWYDIEKKILKKKLEPILGYYRIKRNLITNRKHQMMYSLLNSIYKTIKWLSPYKFCHTLDSIYLCLKYPFLYPRNRFSGLHYNNYKILNIIDKLKHKAFIYPVVHFLNDKDYIKEVNFNEDTVVFDTSESTEKNIHRTTVVAKLITLDGRELILNTTETIIINNIANTTKKNVKYNAIKKTDGNYYIYDNNTWYSLEDVFVKDSDVFKQKENGEYENEITHFYVLPIDYNYKFLADALKWFHDYVLGFIFCIPTFNELDALDEGWRRKFGLRLCDDVKAQLKKDNMLYSFRITQIKEKFGGLRFYFASGSREMYDLINKYEGESYKTCITCGRPAKYMTTGWICPYCENCIGDISKAKKIGE